MSSQAQSSDRDTESVADDGGTTRARTTLKRTRSRREETDDADGGHAEDADGPVDRAKKQETEAETRMA